MNPFPTDIMAEATRLTRAGRLAEATALLRRALRGGADRAPASSAPHGTQAPPAGSQARRVFDVEPAADEALDPVAVPSPGAAGGIPPRDGDPRATEGLAGGAGQAGLDGILDRLRKNGLRPGHRAKRPHPPARPPEPLPSGASFTSHPFSNDAGHRAYKLYQPGNRRDAPAALIVMLHGCTQSPDDFAAGTRMNALAEQHGFLVAYPAQASSANAQKCWNWFSPDDQRRDQGEPSLIAGITRQVMRDRAVDARRVYIAGLSAGGAAAAIMGLAYPDVYAAVGVHSGLACGAAGDVPSAFAAMRQGAAGPPSRPGGTSRLVPTIVFHADRDGTVHPRNGEQVIAQTAAASPTELRTKVERDRVPGGHAYSRTLHLDDEGRAVIEHWLVHGGGHAWSGGSPAGSYTDPRGPDASREMVRFFLNHVLEAVGPRP